MGNLIFHPDLAWYLLIMNFSIYCSKLCHRVDSLLGKWMIYSDNGIKQYLDPS